MGRLGENGFTVQELLAVVLLLFAVTIPSLFLLHRQTYESQILAAQRRIAVAELMEEIHLYVKDTGQLPSAISNKMEPIGSGPHQVDLCKELAPTYVKVLPADPIFGMYVKCDGHSSYETGLGIEKTGKGTQVIIAALASAASGKLIYFTD